MAMSAVRLRYFPATTPAFLLRTTSHSLTLLHITSTKPVFHNYSRQYAAATSAATTTVAPPHPWPEWVSFIDRLKSAGYFTGGHNDTDNVYRDFKLLKEPCISFARDRYDIFRSLSKADIRNVVEVGCPIIVRKVINSAKRLRVYVGLEEKDVCEICSLKGSCDRAFLKANESENVRTVDVMRVLLYYALDPMVISGVARPTSIEQAESSARRLMSMFMDLSEASEKPASVELPNTKINVVNSTSTVQSDAPEMWNGEWICPKCSFLNFSRNVICRKCNVDSPKKQESAHVESKKGDWSCPQCKFLNNAKDIRCRECNEDAPKKQERVHIKPKENGWHCPKCDFLNYRRNIRCRKCNEDAPEKPEAVNVETKRGDWKCHECGFANFARRTSCLQCKAARSRETLKPGEWICAKCYFLNFKRNAACLKCDSKQVVDAAELHKDQVWVKPAPTANS